MRVGLDLGDPRFIPARAGNTRVELHAARVVSVHPRACGEHNLNLIECHVWHGSSPRVRGTLTRADLHNRLIRFIPARAGNTDLVGAIRRFAIGSSPRVRGTPVSTAQRDSRFSVHPRACGEHIFSLRGAHLLGGSSPRVRGTLEHSGYDAPGNRFIPARAGNTPACACSPRTQAVHPRACGEHPRRREHE